MRYFVVDTETSGLDPNQNQIMQIGAAVYEDGIDKPVDVFSMLVEWDEKSILEPAAFKKNNTSLNLLYNTTLRNQLNYVIRSFVDFRNKNACDLLVGFNVGFDIGFLQAAFRKSKVNFQNFLPYKVVDPFVIGQGMIAAGLLTMRYQTLSAYCDYYEIKQESAHEALSDVHSTYAVYKAMIEDLRSSKKKLS